MDASGGNPKKKKKPAGEATTRPPKKPNKKPGTKKGQKKPKFKQSKQPTKPQTNTTKPTACEQTRDLDENKSDEEEQYVVDEIVGRIQCTSTKQLWFLARYTGSKAAYWTEAWRIQSHRVAHKFNKQFPVLGFTNVVFKSIQSKRCPKRIKDVLETAQDLHSVTDVDFSSSSDNDTEADNDSDGSDGIGMVDFSKISSDPHPVDAEHHRICREANLDPESAAGKDLWQTARDNLQPPTRSRARASSKSPLS